jgi:hypothetical protein
MSNLKEVFKRTAHAPKALSAVALGAGVKELEEHWHVL